MSSFPALRQLLTVGDLFAASTFIMALVWLAPFRKTASLRHLAWVAAFGALLALPVLLAVVPSQFSVALAAPSAAPAAHAIAIPQAVEVPIVVAALPQPESFHFDAAMLLRVLLVIWISGVAFVVVRGAAGLFGLHRLRQSSVGHIFRELPKIAQGHDIRISTASDECGPVTWGFVKPIILLPKSADYWPVERVTAVLLHEIAHIRRHDSLTQMVSLVVCAFYWPNPFVWMGARALRRQAEIAADDAVITSGVRPSYYAAELVHLAAQFRSARPALLNMPLNVPMAERAALETRVESILAPTQQRTGVTSMDVLKFACVGLLATSALAFARPSLAQDAPPPPPPPPAEMATPAAPPVPASPAEQLVPPAPPAPVAYIDTGHHHGHIHIVRTFKDRDGHSHTQTIDRDVGPNQIVMDVDPESAMQQVHSQMVQMRVLEAERPRIEAQVRAALDQARAELAKVDDEKIRAKVDAALVRAEAQLARAHADMGDRKVRIEMDGDSDMPPPPPPPLPPVSPVPPVPPAN